MRKIIIIILFIAFSVPILYGQDSSNVIPIKEYKSISEGLNSPEQVIILDLHRPKRIYKEITLFTNLEELNIYMPECRKLPKRIGDLEKLNTLIITGTQKSKIKKLPAELGELKELRWLRLWNIQLKKLPHEIGNLNKLEILELFSNNIKELPDEITKLKRLKKIGIDSNSDLNFYDAFTKLSTLPNLSYLNINYYPHDTLPSNIVELHNLETITIWGNKNATLNVDHCIQYFSKLKKLKKIDLSGVPITPDKKEDIIIRIKAQCGNCEIIW